VGHRARGRARPTRRRRLRPVRAPTIYRSDQDYVFCHPGRGSKLDAEWYAGEFRKALTEAGITDYVRPFHDARHGALTNLAAIGISPVVIMGIAGHRSMQTTKQYVHLAGVVFRDEAAALEARLFGVESSGRKSPQPASLSVNA
jgi:integrase